VAAAVFSSLVQVIFIPPGHFSIEIMQRGTIMLAGGIIPPIMFPIMPGIIPGIMADIAAGIMPLGMEIGIPIIPRSLVIMLFIINACLSLNRSGERLVDRVSTVATPTRRQPRTPYESARRFDKVNQSFVQPIWREFRFKPNNGKALYSL
jgi:hypothetical protein